MKIRNVPWQITEINKFYKKWICWNTKITKK